MIEDVCFFKKHYRTLYKMVLQKTPDYIIGQSNEEYYKVINIYV